MSEPDVLYAAALTLFTLFVVIGLHVSRRPLGTLDARAVYFRGHATPLAIVFTRSGRSKALFIGYGIAFFVYLLARLPLWIPIVLASSQALSQIVVETFKLLFRRVRPDYWLVGLEAGHSYPSGHATTAVISFTGWALVIATSALPSLAKPTLVAAFVFWAAGIAWSRLALGAHYLSDVAGGALFGSAWLCALVAGLLHAAAAK